MTDDTQGRPPGSLGMPVHIARQKLLEQPETAQIAEQLGVDVDTYVDRVLHFAQNPQAQPEFQVVDDADLAEAGADVATFDEVEGWFEGVASGEIDIAQKKGMELSDGFGTAKAEADSLREAAGIPVTHRAPKQEELAGQVKVADDEAGAVLRRQLQEQQRVTQQAIDRQRAKKPPKA